MRSLLFALPFLAIQGALSQSVKSCGGPNDHLKNVVMKVTPDPPVKGGTLTIQASGTLDEAEGGFNSNVDLNITALGIVNVGVKGGVPMTISPGTVAGPFSLTVGPFSLPSNIPGSAVVKGQVHVTNAKNEPIMCIDLDLDVPAMDDKETSVAPQIALPESTWTCSVCGHVYDAATDGGGVAFENLPDTFTCPICGSAKSAFTESVEAPALTTISSCGKATDHIPDFNVASSSGVITMTGTLDEAVTKASIDLDVSLKVLVISLPLKMTIPLTVSEGLIKKGAIKATVGPSTIAVSPDVKATIKGTVKMNDGNSEEITCLNVDTVVAADDTALTVKDDCQYYRKVQDPSCGDICLPSQIGVCPRSIVVSTGGLEAGKCADKGYTVDKGEQDQEAGPCGTLKIELWAKADDTALTVKDDCQYYRKVQDPSCGDICLPSQIGVCPRSIVVSTGGLEAGKCADKGYTVDKGEQDQEAGPCGTLKIEKWAKADKIIV